MIIDKEKLKLPNWEQYSASQLDYYSNAERHDLICRYKLMQICQNFYIARENLIFSDERMNYGDLVEDESGKECMQKLFIQNALIYYNFCVDLSWVMVFLFCLPQTQENFNISEDEVIKAEKIVNFDFLTEWLKYQINITKGNLRNNLELLLCIIDEFWNKIIDNNFRIIYNYTKHQGAFDILNINPEKFFELVGIETNIDIIESKKFDITEMTNMCIEFNNSFVEYMEKIIKIVIEPSNTKELYDFNEIAQNILRNSIKNDKK